MKTIVCLVDFSDAAPKVIEQGCKFAKPFGARVILLHVVPKVPVAIDLAIVSPVIEEAPGPAVIAADAARLTGLGRRFTDLGIDVLVQQLDAASVPALVHECEKWEADLIIVGSHHHSLLYRWLIGSMTSDVLKLARCPVLVVPADVETAGGN